MAAGFEVGSWVSFKTADDEYHRGTVTQKHGKLVRIVDKDKRQYTTSQQSKGRKIQLKSIRAVPFGVFVFDTQLDKGWRSRRRSHVFWEEYCHHADWTFAYERVHSKPDIEYMLGKRIIKERVLLFSGHGSRGGGWVLSDGTCFDRKTTLKVHEKNRHKVVVFSSCEIGANASLMRHYKDVLGAAAVISYTDDINDSIAFLAEPALLQLLDAGQDPDSAVEKVREAFDNWKGINKKHAKQFPMVCV